MYDDLRRSPEDNPTVSIILCAQKDKSILRVELVREQRLIDEKLSLRKSAQSVFYRNPSAFIRVHLRLISVSLSDRTRKIQLEVENPQGFGIDERRFVNLNIQRFSEVYSENGLTESPQSTQRAQSLSIPVAAYEKVAASRFRTRMTRIARIFTDTRASSSAQSDFSCIYSLIDEDTNPQISQIRADLPTWGQT